MKSLIPCAACGRHLNADQTVRPFGAAGPRAGDAGGQVDGGAAGTK